MSEGKGKVEGVMGEEGAWSGSVWIGGRVVAMGVGTFLGLGVFGLPIWGVLFCDNGVLLVGCDR